MASHISFSIFSSLWDRISMSLLIFWLVIRRLGKQRLSALQR
ncbi:MULTISPECIES: hypothetical protein [Bacteroidales]|uniref:Uncharacterized protein n=1 Tax=Bacteroides uniformis TaxID=820 RepID=A0A6N2V872_BACUN